MAAKKRAINFDLDTHKLKQFYPKKNYRQAYRDIKKFMTSHGFVHRQWSGYISEKPMSRLEITRVISMMSKTFPWLKQCANKVDMTNIGKQFDMMPVIVGAKKHQSQQITKTKVQVRPLTVSRATMQSRAKNIQAVPKNPSKTKQNQLDI